MSGIRCSSKMVMSLARGRGVDHGCSGNRYVFSMICTCDNPGGLKKTARRDSGVVATYGLKGAGNHAGVSPGGA